MKKIIIALTAILLLMGFTTLDNQNGKPLEEMTLSERFEYYFDGMVRAAKDNDRARYYRLEQEFNKWAESLPEHKQHELMQHIMNWRKENAKAYEFVMEWSGGR